MEKVANHIYLLTPSGVEVTPDERRKLADRSYADD
jgi:FtsZ-interacting cell division protein YlmF